MATASVSGIDNLQGLLNLYQNAKGSSASQTSQNNVSGAGANHVLKQLMESVNGLASVSQGQRGAGMYNSSTNQLLTNDLLSRTAGEVAKLNSSTTTSTKKGGAIGTPELLGMLGMTAGKSLLGPTVSGMAKKYGTENWGKDLAESFGLGSSGSGGFDAVSSGGTNMFEGLNAADFSNNISSDIIDSSLSSFADYGYSLASSSAADMGTDVAASTIAEEGGSSFADIFSNLFS